MRSAEQASFIPVRATQAKCKILACRDQIRIWLAKKRPGAEGCSPNPRHLRFNFDLFQPQITQMIPERLRRNRSSIGRQEAQECTKMKARRRFALLRELGGLRARQGTRNRDGSRQGAKHAKAERETHSYRSPFTSFPSVRWIGCPALCILRALLGNSI